MIFLRLPFLICVGTVVAQYHPTTTPVPILKQINRHNEDGSYSYGFEAADGSYKIESKYPTGEVFGKYGFIDDTGSLREVEYGASRRGFEPAGTDINVPPPTLTGNSIGQNEPEDDGQYREDPSIYYTDPKYTNGERYDPVPKLPLAYQRPVSAPAPYQVPSKSIAAAYRQPAPQPQPQREYRPQYRTAQHLQAQPQNYQPQHYQPQPQHYQQQPQRQYQNSPIIKRYDGQAAYNTDNLSSYSVQY